MCCFNCGDILHILTLHFSSLDMFLPPPPLGLGAAIPCFLILDPIAIWIEKKSML